MKNKRKSIPAYCDAGCKKNFTVTKFHNRKVKHGIEKNYFRCPHCKHEYVTYYASKETLELQKEMRKLQRAFAKVNAIKDDLEYRSLLLQTTKLKAKIKQSMDEARAVAEN